MKSTSMGCWNGTLQIEYIHPCAVIHTVGGRSQIYLSVADSTGVEPGGTASGSSWRTIETTAPLPIANEAEAWAAQRNDKTVTPEALGIYKRTQEEATRALARLLAAVNGNTNAIAAIPRLPASASPAEAAAAVITNKRVTPASLGVYKQRLDLAQRQVRDVDETFTLVGRSGIGRKNLFALFQNSQIGDSFSLAPDRLVFERDIGVFRINIGEVQISTPKFLDVVPTLTVAKRQLTSNGQQDITFNVYNRTTGHAAHMRVNSYSV